MNIMLTDITALTPEQQEVSMVVKADAGGFAGLFSQQFPRAPEKDGQSIDFNDFLEKIPMQTKAAEITPELPTAASDGDFPLYGSVKIAQDPGAVLNAPAEAVKNLVTQTPPPDSNSTANGPTSMEKGEMLPIGGNLLPDNAGLEIAKSGMLAKAVAPEVTVAVSAETIRSATSEVLPASLSQVTRAPTVATQADKVPSPKGATIGVAEKGFAKANFVAVMGKSSVPEAEQVIAPDKIIRPESTQTINKQLSPQASPDAETGVAGKMRASDTGTAAPPARPAELAGLTLQTPIPAVASLVTDRSALVEPVRKGLNQNVSRDIAAAPLAITDRVLLPAERVAAAETLSARDMQTTPDYRALETPMQPVANTAQQNLALSTSAAQMFSAVSPPLAASAQPNALPGHFETLTLVRNADSTELGSGLNERVNWMINQKQNTATIRLDPPFLGKLDVQIKIADDVTTVVFQTQHAQTRDLIESASVRLRDFLQESGYQNVNVDVSQRQDQQQARSQAGLDADADQQDESYQDPDLAQPERDAASYFIGDGIVDTFA